MLKLQIDPTVFVTFAGAIVASVGYVVDLTHKSLDARRKAIDERLTNLINLQSLLQASWVIFDIQNMHAQKLLESINKNQSEILINGGDYGFVEFPEAFPKFTKKEEKLHELIRSITINSMNPINESLMNWLKNDTYFKAQWQREDLYGDLSKQLSQLEAHLLLWQAKYKFAITSEKPENALVYMADEEEHGVAFPPRLNEIVYKLLGNASACYNQGNVFYSRGRYENAIKAYEKAIEIDPNLAGAWHNKGETLKSLGRSTEADAAFSKAKELGYEDKPSSQ